MVGQVEFDAVDRFPGAAAADRLEGGIEEVPPVVPGVLSTVLSAVVCADGLGPQVREAAAGE